jgi:hypothetical protein
MPMSGAARGLLNALRPGRSDLCSRLFRNPLPPETDTEKSFFDDLVKSLKSRKNGTAS